MGRRWAILVAALWWGGISGLAFVAVPALFSKLGSPALAGPVAAWLFAFLCKLTWACSVFLLIFWAKNHASSLSRCKQLAMLVLILAVLAALVQDVLVAQQIVSARSTGGNLRLWHTLGSVLVLAQWLAAGASLWWLSSPQAACPEPAKC
jgi:Domain of unknown function (DUF4149)